MLRVKNPHYDKDLFIQPRTFYFNQIKLRYIMKRLTVHVTDQPRVDTQAPAVINKKATSQSSAESALDQGKADRERALSGRDKSPGKKGRYKVYTTLSVKDLKSTGEVETALAEIRKVYNIAICKDSNRSYWKPGDEMYHVSNQK